MIDGEYHSLCDLPEEIRETLIKENPPFPSDEPNLKQRIKVYDLERNWPKGRGVFYNSDKTFHVWVNENEHLQLICTIKGSDIKCVFETLSRYSQNIT